MVSTAVTPSDLEGTWHLVASHRLDAQADPSAPGARIDGNGEWIRTSGVSQRPVATPVHGLVLTITAEGDVSESGTSAVSLFDAEGVETAGEGFDARLEWTGSLLSVFAADRVDEPVQGIADPTMLRLSDGDTDIAEFFELAEGQLVRTQNVVTDGLYLTRLALIYDRTAPEVSAAPAPTADETARRAAEAELVAALERGYTGPWKEIVSYCAAEGSMVSIMTFSVETDPSGAHRLHQDEDPESEVDAKWKAHRAVARDGAGKTWGTAVVVLRRGDEPIWEVDYAPNAFLAGKPDDRRKRYSRYLKVFLSENGLER